MTNKTETQSNNLKELKTLILNQQNQILELGKKHEKSEKKYLETESNYKLENDLLRERIRLLTAQLYGRSTEKRNNAPELKYAQTIDLFPVDTEETDLEENSEDTENTENNEETITVPSHTRKKKGRKSFPSELPRVEVIHDLTEEEKKCKYGTELKLIGEETTEELDVIPAQVQIIRHIRKKYACSETCECALTGKQTIKIAPLPEKIFPKSLATGRTIAHTMTAKFCDALPFYRQEKQYKRIGIELNRNTMCNWAMKVAEKCSPLIELFKKEIKTGPKINIDETTVQVMNEENKSNNTKSYMWSYSGGPPGKPVFLFEYDPRRSAQVAKNFIGDYQGFVQTDGYVGYDFLDSKKGIVHVGCFAHARRKFKEVLKGAPKKKKYNGKKGLADKALEFIGNLYKIEKELKIRMGDNFDHKLVYSVRQEYSVPILKDFQQWLMEKKPSVPESSLLGKAISYTLNQWHRLDKYVESGFVQPDNNLAENAIRPFVIGRKNWLFSGTPEGAKASAVFYSLIETAKANDIEPYHYLNYIFDKLPSAKNEEELRALLPQNLNSDLMRNWGH